MALETGDVGSIDAIGSGTSSVSSDNWGANAQPVAYTSAPTPSAAPEQPSTSFRGYDSSVFSGEAFNDAGGAAHKDFLSALSSNFGGKTEQPADKTAGGAGAAGDKAAGGGARAAGAADDKGGKAESDVAEGGDQKKDLKPGTGLKKNGEAPNQDVKAMQQELKRAGFDIGHGGKDRSGVDGQFGPKTEAAVRAAQKKLGLPETGVADANTLDKLKSMPAGGGNPLSVQGQGQAGQGQAGQGQASPALTGNAPAGTGAAHRARSTAYFPYNNQMEGGHLESRGLNGQKAGPVNTIDDWANNRHWDLKSNSYKEGRPPWVTLAGDPKLFGKNVSVDQFPGVPFRIMDTGGRFQNSGWNKFDIAVGSHNAPYRQNQARSYQSQFNSGLTVREMQ